MTSPTIAVLQELGFRFRPSADDEQTQAFYVECLLRVLESADFKELATSFREGACTREQMLARLSELCQAEVDRSLASTA